MDKREFLYEGKAKQIYQTDDPDLVIVHYKDDATAFNGVKKMQISNKGYLNNRISELIFEKLTDLGVPNHFVKRLNEREQLVKKVQIIPLEVICRNLIAGSMAKRLDIEEGKKPMMPIYELCYKNDALGDPLINDYHALALDLCTKDELDTIYDLTKKINHHLSELFIKEGIILVDFKIEFGRTSDQKVILADEISPDTCRFWDQATMKKLDKDRFRRDLGSVEEAYLEILERISN